MPKYRVFIHETYAFPVDVLANDSDPEAEIEESWGKARPLLAAIGSRLREEARSGR